MNRSDVSVHDSALREGLSFSHLPGLDGLRMVAVFLVVFYHSGFQVVPGGHGVLAFFVLSGFLITWLLLKEESKYGAISLRLFYLRRALRIFPAFYCFWLLTTAAFLIFHRPINWPQAFSSLAYVNNYYQAIFGDPNTGYSHTWSLGIEEQFYLLWPISMISLRRTRTRVTFLIAAIGSIWIYRAVLQFVVRVHSGYFYEAFDTRADHLLIGCLLAVLLRSDCLPHVWDRLCAQWISIVALALLAISASAASMLGAPYRNVVGFAIDPLLVAIVIVQAIALRNTPLWGWLNWRWVRYLGVISYSIYLYQQIVIDPVKGAFRAYPLAVRMAAAVAAVILIASASYYLIELPLLRLKDRAATRISTVPPESVLSLPSATTVFSMRPAIAIVAASLDILGGQGVQARALMNALRRDGHDMTFVPVNPRFPAGLGWLRRFPYVRTLFNEVLYICQLPRLRRSDAVHIFSASYWSFMLGPAPAILAAKLFGKAAILHYHSGEAADHLKRWRRVIAPFLRLADEIVVPSTYLCHVFEQYGYRTRVIPNVVDTSEFRFRERTPLRPRLLSVRNLEPYYCVDNTILAFARLKERFPEATLTIAGYGSLERSLRMLVIRLGLTDVDFVGGVTPKALPTVYDAADIAVNSSVVDNQPVSILEAFSCGLPVVSTPAGDIAAMLRQGETGVLVSPEDPVDMANAVVQLLQDPETALQLARRARGEVERYTWPAVRGLWAMAYADALDQSFTDSTTQHVQRNDRQSAAPRVGAA
jgi:peptidoglycan/LPS O-acetylase OafA/YrhL/glycosyltransferase involved in cell wall biosynthesis